MSYKTGTWLPDEIKLLESAKEESDQPDVISAECKRLGLMRSSKQIKEKLKSLGKASTSPVRFVI